MPTKKQQKDVSAKKYSTVILTASLIIVGLLLLLAIGLGVLSDKINQDFSAHQGIELEDGQRLDSDN